MLWIQIGFVVFAIVVVVIAALFANPPSQWVNRNKGNKRPGSAS